MPNIKDNCKLIYICENDLSRQIGGTIHVHKILSAFRKMNVNFTLIAPRYNDAPLMLPDGIEARIIATPRVRVLSWLYFYLASSLLIFAIWLKHRRVIIYSREMPYNLGLPLLVKALHIPLIIELNGVFLQEMQELHYHRLSFHLSRWLEKLVLESTSTIAAVSDEIIESTVALLNLDRRKLIALPNGTDPDIFFPKDRDESRTTLGINTNAFIIGFIGSCYPYHDIDTLISTIPQLVQRIPETRLYVVGDGFMRKKWQQLAIELDIETKVVFTGYVPFREANNYINAFDICCASYKEGTSVFPMKILDCMSSEKAIIASDIPTINKYFKPMRRFLLVPPGNVAALAESILELYTLRDEPVSGHREFVLARYTWDHTARNILHLIEQSLCAV